jgi:4-amino-4-deoxychorismate lyase
MAVSAGKPEFWTRHMAKLASDCSGLGIPAPDAALLAADARRLLAGQDRTVLKIIVTRGAGGRGYKPPEQPTPTRIVLLAPWPDYPAALAEQGVMVHLCDTRLGLQPKLAGIKHLNRLEQVLARNEWSDPAISEGLMCDSDGHVVEGVMSNLFVVRDGKLATPELSRCGVAGIMRGLILEAAARRRIDARIADLTLDDVRSADELFLTNSLIGLWPVRAFDGQSYAVGPLTRELGETLADMRATSRMEFSI